MKLLRPSLRLLFAACAVAVAPPGAVVAGPPAPKTPPAVVNVVNAEVALSPAVKEKTPKKRTIPGSGTVPSSDAMLDAVARKPQVWYAASEKDQAHPRALAAGRCALASGGFVKCVNGASVTLRLGTREQVYNVPNKWLELPFVPRVPEPLPSVGGRITSLPPAPVRATGQGPGLRVGGGKTGIPFGGRWRGKSGAGGKPLPSPTPRPTASPSP